MYLGELAELTRRVSARVREAERRGDRYAAVNMRTRLNFIWLARDDPDGGERDLEDAVASWMPWTTSFQVQHFFALHSRCELELYRGNARAAASAMEEQYNALRRSLLLRVVLVRVEIGYLRGRIALALAAADVEPEANVRRARKLASSLAKEKSTLSTSLAAVLRAGVARVLERDQEATDELRAAVALLDEHETMLIASTARLRLATMIGEGDGKPLSAEVDQWMSEQCIDNPARMTAMLIPGWPDEF
jgi:hypothetical protein